MADLTTAANGTESYLRNLNYEYNNGLVDKDFYPRDDDNKTKAEFVAGKTGNYAFYLANNTDVLSPTLKNDPKAQFAVLPPEAVVPEGLKPQGRAYWPFGLIMGINYESSDMERAAVWMYLEWMSQPANLFLLQNGIEGQNYTTLDADRHCRADRGFRRRIQDVQQQQQGLLVAGHRVAQYSTLEVTRKAYLRNWSPKGFEYLAEDLLKNYDKVAEFRTPDALFNVVLEKVNEYKADLNSLFQELYVKCVIAPEAEFDGAVYEAAKKTYLDAGYQEILDEKQAAIDAGANSTKALRRLFRAREATRC